VNISEIKIFLSDEKRLKAYVCIILDDCFVIRDLKIIDGPSGLFVSMPNKKLKDGGFKDIAHPINKETRFLVEKTILNAYNLELTASGSKNTEIAQIQS
jgi:stage V sporulation protein G